jgi:hypothetical protein
VQVPNGLAFSEFRGYEDRQTAAVSQTGNLIEVILANPAMIEAYRGGVTGSGTPFPRWLQDGEEALEREMSAEAPAPTTVPDTLHDVDFMMQREVRRQRRMGICRFQA